ncbi:hypothetical protein BGZ73_001789 [Actinomortierella ambigua]|nr:hypothetical protein BGZ73_001789 [Actinomortierella ambigua]
MTNKQDHCEAGEQRVPRTSQSLASAPLRLLSHSFHSTNAHVAATPSSSLSSAACPSTIPQGPELNTLSDLQQQQQQQQAPPCPSDDHDERTITTDVEPLIFLRNDHGGANLLHQRHHNHYNSTAAESSLTLSYGAKDAADHRPWKRRDARKRSARVEQGKLPSSSSLAVPKALPTLAPSEAQSHLGEGYARLLALLQPYDIRMGIFSQLSLLDICSLQLTCRLLQWATSDQSLWKQLALNLIQGEFYFDVPRTLPPKVPSWKHFCKRHMLRQKNWRKGLVQDVIALDDHYKKLTTLQTTAPYILTGCDDGRIHLWHLNDRKLLHCFNVHGEITWVEHLQEHKVVAGLGYDIEKCKSQIRLFSTESGEQIGFYEEPFWDLAIAAINRTFLVASDGDGRFTVWNWKSGEKVSDFRVPLESSITEALYFVQDTILELHYDGLIRLFSITGECFGRFTLDNILPNHQVSFCWLHNDFSMVVWEESNTMAHIRLPLLQQGNNREMATRNDSSASKPHATSSSSTSASVQAMNPFNRPISQEEWDAQGAEIYWRHQLQHTCNFAAMGGGRFQLLYVQIFENMMDQVPIRVHSLRHNNGSSETSETALHPQQNQQQQQRRSTITAATNVGELDSSATASENSWQHHGEYVTAHSDDPELEKIIQGLRPSRIDCDPEYIVVGLLEGGVRLLQFAPKDDDV